MRILFYLFFTIITGLVYAQPSQVAIESNTLNLEERYSTMKAGSQTFKDYKVIKESVLDKVWKITLDSISKQKQQLAEVKNQVKTLQEELKTLNSSMEAQQASMKEVIYDSTHITVLGIPFSKAIFLIIVTSIIGGLIFVLSVAFTRIKMSASLVKEKTLIADSIGHEFEDFKKKSMEKQTKLSRELQNERNKWQELRKS